MKKLAVNLKSKLIPVIRDDKGLALLFSLVFCLILLLGGVVFLKYYVSGAQLVANNHRSIQAYYLARAGAAATSAWMIDAAEDADSLIGTETTAGSAMGPGEIARIKVYYKDPAEPYQQDGVVIESTGSVDGMERQAVLTLTKGQSGYKPVYDVAVFSQNAISLGSSAKIYGDVGTNQAVPASVAFDWSTSVYGNVLIGPGGNPQVCVTYPNWSEIKSHLPGGYDAVHNLAATRSYPLPEFPSFPTDLPNRGNLNVDYRGATINSDGHYSNITVSGGGVLTIDVGSSTRRIRVGSLSVGEGFITLQGTGKLILYVDNSITISGSSIVNFKYGQNNKKVDGDPQAIMIYYKGASMIVISGGIRLVSCIYVENADVKLDGSGGFVGNIITGGSKVEITGGATADVKAIYAPNALVDFSGSGELRGALVANSIKIGGGSSITYDSSIKESFPLTVGESTTYRMGRWQ